jgi:hypothetical protein
MHNGTDNHPLKSLTLHLNRSLGRSAGVDRHRVESDASLGQDTAVQAALSKEVGGGLAENDALDVSSGADRCRTSNLPEDVLRVRACMSMYARRAWLCLGVYECDEKKVRRESVRVYIRMRVWYLCLDASSKNDLGGASDGEILGSLRSGERVRCERGEGGRASG